MGYTPEWEAAMHCGQRARTAALPQPHEDMMIYCVNQPKLAILLFFPARFWHDLPGPESTVDSIVDRAAKIPINRLLLLNFNFRQHS
jgi:hypothetical protein